MNRVTDTYEISDEIFRQLQEGILVRTGSVIRHASGKQNGQFFMFLDPIHLENMKENETNIKHFGNAVKEKTDFVKDYLIQNKKLVGGIIVVGAFVGGGLWIAHKIKAEKVKEAVELQEKLYRYKNKVNNGEITVKEIHELLFAFEMFEIKTVGKKVKYKIQEEKFRYIADELYNYTLHLAREKNQEKIIEKLESEKKGIAILDIQQSLKYQENLMKAV